MIGKSLLLSFCLAASFTVSGAEQEQSELELYTQLSSGDLPQTNLQAELMTVRLNC